MNDLGKMMVMAGLAIVAAGLLVWSGLGRGWWGRLGRLPGDIHYHGGRGSFYFPIVTCLLLSIVISVIVWVIRKL